MAPVRSRIPAQSFVNSATTLAPAPAFWRQVDAAYGPDRAGNAGIVCAPEIRPLFDARQGERRGDRLVAVSRQRVGPGRLPDVSGAGRLSLFSSLRSALARV